MIRGCNISPSVLREIPVASPYQEIKNKSELPSKINDELPSNIKPIDDKINRNNPPIEKRIEPRVPADIILSQFANPDRLGIDIKEISSKGSTTA